MSYPSDSPSTDIYTFWNSGNYTPENVSSEISNNVSALVSTSFSNSYGKETSVLQNYINSHYIGRESSPINSGWLTNLYFTNISGHDILYNSGTFDFLYHSGLNGSVSGITNITNYYNSGNIVHHWDCIPPEFHIDGDTYSIVWIMYLEKGEGFHLSVMESGGDTHQNIFENISGDIALKTSGYIDLLMGGWAISSPVSGLYISGLPTSNPGPNMLWVDLTDDRKIKMGS